ncbi:MAG: hypothetical protein PHS86_03195 [Syntrophaceae bacterium]|nr:hypothetical protein [Syntrophaceae bacterium]
MANTGNSIKWEAVREIAAASITTSFQNFGGVFLRDSFRIWITNNTNGDWYLTTDGSTNMLKIPAQTGRAYDNKTNDMFLKAGTQFQIKWVSAPGVPDGWGGLEVEYV